MNNNMAQTFNQAAAGVSAASGDISGLRAKAAANQKLSFDEFARLIDDEASLEHQFVRADGTNITFHAAGGFYYTIRHESYLSDHSERTLVDGGNFSSDSDADSSARAAGAVRAESYYGETYTFIFADYEKALRFAHAASLKLL